MKVIGHRIGGNVISDKSSRFGDVFNPATGEVESKIALASIPDVDKAVNAAKKALPVWSETPPIQRARILFKYKQLIEENIDELLYQFDEFAEPTLPKTLHVCPPSAL